MGVLNKEHGYVFLHVPRTAGTSMTNMLINAGGERFSGIPDLASAIHEYVAANDLVLNQVDHVRATHLREILGPSHYDGLESFAVVREPWGRLQSLYRYQRGRDWSRVDRKMNKKFQLPFSEFVMVHCREPHYQMVIFVNSPDGKPLVKTILRFDRLAEDLRALSFRVPAIPTNLPKLNVTADRCIDCRFDERAIAAVQDAYADDFECFDFPDHPYL